MSEVQDCAPNQAIAEATASATDTASPVSTTTPAAATPSENSRPSSLPKPSGLKLPSKIGRLCSNSAPKPAVPISPRTDGGSSDTLRKFSDDLSRKHLSDLLEAEEDEVSSTFSGRPSSHRKASTSSSFSMSSMDALWEKHPRRLSEAGLRRSSDHSVVLTEDTDSFIIGERVWVGGTKPGQIAYIGETQFAPGDWAGIVLDDAIGKNDGSVAGHRYFQCSEKRGVFSRLTRLTRNPLPGYNHHDSSPTSEAGSVFERPPSGLARPRRAQSPNGSVRSVSSKMNASITTTTSSELRLGDRVIVSSSRGSKAGTLRYVGVTDFAPGVWAGVELDDPLGKNDGSVEDKRYFECAPRFGLFAPISKVSRSPSNRKPGSCAIHSNGRGTPLRRSNSRESLTSISTSIASSRPRPAGLTQRLSGPRASSTPVSAKGALQELLREKQHHLERLMRERELERAEIAKISVQAARSESALEVVKKEVTETIAEKEKLKEQLEKLNKQLHDERQKVEDLMFRNEEENINKEDYYKYKEMMEKEKSVHEQRIRELEAEAALQTDRADTTAAALRLLEEQRSAEVQAMAEQHKEELTAAQTLSFELQKLLDEAYALLKEKDNEKDSVGKSLSEELSKLKSESEKALNEAKSKLSIVQSELETQVSVLTAKLQLTESKLETEKQSLERLNKDNGQVIVDLNSRLAQLQAALDDKTLEFNKIVGTGKEHEVTLNKEITKLKMELSAKILDVEQLEDSKRKQENACKNLQDELTRVKEEYTNKFNEYETMLNETSKENEKMKSDVFELQQKLSAKVRDYEKLLNDSSTTSSSTEQLINEYKQSIHERDKDIIKLKNEFEQATANFNVNHSKIAEEHKKEIEERDMKIEQLSKEIQTHKVQLDQTKTEFDTLNSQFVINVDEIKSLKEENERLIKLNQELVVGTNSLKEKIAAMELEIGELTRQHNSINEKCNELQKSKDKIESEYMNLTGQATNSNDQFVELSKHLKETEKELQEVREKHREASNNYGRVEQELKQKLFKLQEDFALERSQLIQSVNDSMEKLEDREEKIKQYEIKLSDMSNNVTDMTSNSDKLTDENTNLRHEIQALKEKEQVLNTEYESLRKKLEIDIERYKEEVNILKAEGATSEVKLMEKVDQLTEAQNDLNNKLEEARKHEDSLQKVITDMTAQINNQKAEYENEVSQIKNQLLNVTNECAKLKEVETQFQRLIEEKQNTIKELTLKLEMLEVDLKSNIEMINEKERQLAQGNEEYSKSCETKKVLEQKLNEAAIEISSLKLKYENLIANATAEETVLKDQENQLESLRKEITTLGQDKSLLEVNCQKYLTELNSIKEDHNSVTIKLQETVNSNEELNKSLNAANLSIKLHNEKLETDLGKIKTLEVDINKLKQEVAQKDILVKEKETEITKINEYLQAGTTETQDIIKRLQEENSLLNVQHKTEVDKVKNLQEQIAAQANQIQELEKAKEKVVELQERLMKSELDIKQLTTINEGQKSNYEDLNKQLQTQFDELRKEAKHAKQDHKAKLHEYEKALEDSRDKNKLEINKQNELQQKITETDNKLVEVTNRLELLSVQENANIAKDDKLEKLTLELQATRKSTAESIEKSELQIRSLKVEVDSKIKDLKYKDDYLNRIQEELKNYKAKLEVSEREKLMLQKEMSLKTKDKNDNESMGDLGQGDTLHKTSSAKDSEIDGQVSFLNSVIVDMQRKNEQLMARVQALEGAGIIEAPVFNGHKPRVIAPRLFCDICDIFDAHDTEDCPKQAPDVDAPAEHTPSKPRPAPRPYCDICEVFGHLTEKCDEEETF